MVENEVSTRKELQYYDKKKTLFLLFQQQDNEEGYELNKYWQQITNFEDVDGDFQFGYMFLQEPKSQKNQFYKYVTT